MSESSLPPGDEHAPLGAAELRRRIANALEDVLSRYATRELAQRLDVAATTIHRRDSDLRLWPSVDLLELATIDSDLRFAVVAFLTGARLVRGSATRATQDMHLLLALEGDVMAKVSSALAGSRIRPSEANALLESIAARRKHEDEFLIPDLRVIARGDR
jgi:hypothetical protein